MCRVTKRLARRLKAGLQKMFPGGVPEHTCFRLAPKKWRPRLVLDEIQLEDFALQYNGATVLVIDPLTSAACRGLTLDYNQSTHHLELKRSQRPA